MKKPMQYLLTITSLLFMACSSSKTATDNNLAKIEKDAGYKLLFDGRSLKGWRTYQNKPADSWSVVDGVLYCKGSSTDKSDRRADIITTRQFENFDLSLDWKISPQGNSGIIYDKNFPAKLEDWQKTGANYAMDAAPAAEPNPVGEWNHTRIMVNKGHVEHWLNGKKVVDYQLCNKA